MKNRLIIGAMIFTMVLSIIMGYTQNTSYITSSDGEIELHGYNNEIPF